MPSSLELRFLTLHFCTEYGSDFETNSKKFLEIFSGNIREIHKNFTKNLETFR